MRKAHWLGVCGLTSLLGACEGDPGQGDPGQPIETVQRPIIDGTDDRRDIFELDPAGAVARNADGVPLLVFNGGLVAHDGVVDLPNATFAAARNVCSSERFVNQPVVTVGQCSSYLVGPRLVATAGHCTNFSPPGTDVSFLSAAFGFRMIDAATARTTVAAAEVYRVVGVRGLCPSADCTVLELERPVTNHFILSFRRSGSAAEGDSLYLLGHPHVLPLKFNGPGPLFRTVDIGGGNFNIIMQQLDVSAGNSGSAIVSSATNVVEGTLSGRSDIGLPELDPTPAGCNVEHHAVPSDGYFSTGWGAASIAEFVPPRCSGDAGGWPACGANGCGICAGQLDTAVFDRYLQNHPNCVIDTACSGPLTACSEACPAPTPADSSGPQPQPVCEAGRSFVVEARARVLNGTGAPGAVLNAGSGITQIGVDARSGTIQSAGPVQILARATVTGDVTSASTISPDPAATVTGVLRPNTPVFLPSLPTLPAFPAPTAGNFVVNSGTQTRAPGSYGSGTVNGGTLVLSGGDYFFRSFVINNGTTVRATPTTRIFVRDVLVFRSSVRPPAGTAVQPIVLGFGGTSAALEARFDGTLVAPGATVTFGAGAGLTFTGSFFASVIDVRPGSTLVCR
jgi:hypothetical protein